MSDVPDNGDTQDVNSDAFTGGEEDISPPVRRVGFSARKDELEPVESLFESTSNPEGLSSPMPSPPQQGRKSSRKEQWETRRARRNQRSEQIKRREQITDKRHARRPFQWRYNLLALFFFIATLGFLAYFALLWTNPQSPLNPFPPATPLPIFVTATPLGGAGTDAQDEINRIVPDLRFVVSGEISYRAHVNCDYASIAGNVESGDGAVYAVRISGSGLDSGVFSGSMLEYGRGGFEFQIADMPVADTFIIQLFTTDEIPVSEQIVVSTRATCEENVAFIQFVEGN